MKTPEIDQQINILTQSYCRLDEIMDFVPEKIVELDLGCGKGGFSSKLAQQYPERTVLAADVMLGRLRKLVKRNNRLNIENIHILRVEARHLVAYMLPDASLDRLHLLCPDPWPKGRHKHHRLLCADLIGRIFRVLKPEGVFHFATDDDYYFDTVNLLLEKSGVFKHHDSAIQDIADLKTDFEIRWTDQGKIVKHCSWLRSS